MKLAINLVLSFAVMLLFVWLIWPNAETRAQLDHTIHALRWADFAPYLFGYLGLQAVVHFARAWRLNNLLAPLGVKLPAGRLLAISSVGFMAILALPARLGEFVRPGLLRAQGDMSAAAALGTVAVERIVDGLGVSSMVCITFIMLHNPASPGWMMPTAYIATAVFGVALVSLLFALKWPEKSVRFGLQMTLLPRLAPRAAAAIERKLLEMVRGFAVLKDPRNLSIFVGWSALYWIANGLGMMVLARAFGVQLGAAGSFATMGLVAVGIMLPNSPGLVGQFQWFTMLGLSLSLGAAAVDKGSVLYASTFAFALTQYMLQVIWYMGMGALALASPWVSLRDLGRARKLAPEAVSVDAP